MPGGLGSRCAAYFPLGAALLPVAPLPVLLVPPVEPGLDVLPFGVLCAATTLTLPARSANARRADWMERLVMVVPDTVRPAHAGTA